MSPPIRVIDAALVRRLCQPQALRSWMRQAMLATSAGQAALPLRQALTLPQDRGRIGVMPGHLAPARAAGVKLVSLVPPARRRGSSHLGLIVLYDEDGLVPLALLCGATVTALRTAAATALATEHLARPDARTLAILGTGEQAEAHLQALLALRPLHEVRIWGRRPESAAEFARHHGTVQTPARACRDAADAVVTRCRYFVDYRPSTLAQAGELLGAISRGVVTAEHIQGEIGEVIAGRVSGRRDAHEITLYKSLGIAAQDVMTARQVFDQAQAQDLGTLIHL